MVAKKLSSWHKAKYTPIILDRDGSNCFYCEDPFPAIIIQKVDKKKARVFDHLNNDPTDNRPENLCFAHSICNEQKKYKTEWIVKAKKHLRENVKESNLEVVSHANSDKETGTEIDTNAIYYEIAIKYLTDELNPRGDEPPENAQIDFKNAMDVISARVRKRVGHSSQNTARRILDVLSCGEDSWLKVKDDENHKWILVLDPDKEHI